MKTAILLATRKGDALAVKFLCHGVFSEILADFKSRVADDRGEPGYDSLQIWTGPPAKTAARLSSGDVEESVKFDLESGGLPTAEQFAEIVKTWDETHADLIEENETLRAELAELKTKFQSADPQGLENEALLVGNASGESGSLSGGTPPPAKSELPDAMKADGEGDLPVAQAAAPVAESGKDKDASAEASRGSMSPKKKSAK